MPTDINFNKSLGFVRTSRVAVQSIKFAPVNVTPPAITGNTTLGSVLHLASVGQWLNYPSSFTYQWQRDGVDIIGFTNNAYTLVQADSAAFITCVVTATNITGSASTASNQIKADFYTSVPINTVAPVISGSTALSSVLTSTTGTWINSPTSFAYQWKRGATNIGTNSSTYTLVAADSNAAITCVVTATNASGSTPATSNTITAQTYTAPANTVAPVISGSTTLGSVLSSTTGFWTGNPSPTVSYQWKRGATNIGTNSSTYTLVAADSGASITCVVTATNALGSANSTSNTITAGNYIPVNTAAPVISGATTLSSVLTTTTGTWTESPSSYTYQWKRGATNIGINNNNYTLVAADSGAAITCVVTASNGSGSSSPATSNTITADNYAPANTVAPVISGSTALGGVLSSTTGTWNGIPTITYAYQWRRGSTDIPSATSSNYTLVAADSAQNITCRVTATNSVGSGNVISNTITAQTYSAPVNTAAPVISGTTTLGSTLSSTTGTFTGNPTPTYAYQWRRNAVNIPSATGSTYVLVSADSAAAITCVVTATNALGNSSATSNTITADTYASAFTSTWLVTAGETITLPYELSGTYSGTIDWGDSSTSTNSYANRTHTYVGAGTYTISITGVTTGFRFANTGSKLNIKTITNWGTLRLGNSNSYFHGCTNLTLTTVAGTLDLTGTTSFNQMFGACSSLTTVNGINSWNTAAVTNMSYMFNSCTNFNQALSFNTAAVTNMSQMFFSCSVFNSSLTFNTANVTSMSNMFAVCSVFNQPLNFNTASVTSFQSMFFGCSSFNSLCTFTTTAVGCSALEMFYACNSFNTAPIFTSTANITNMNRMFSACSAFNKPLTFDTTSVTNMSFMFTSSYAFNSTLTFSSTANVTNMANMFDGCTAFNQAVPFNTAAVTNMYAMFYACSNFNQALTFNTTAVTTMGGMFSNCTAFNSALTFTSTANVIDMNNMFRSCSAFNQPLNFNTAAVTTFSSFLRGCTNFNQVINFTTTACTIMEEMFMACPAFNSTLTFSSTAAVTNMALMFSGATAFNQNIGSWNVANVTNFANFMSTKTPATFSATNLDAIYNGWITVQSSKTISFGTAQYSAAGVAGRAYLTGTKSWTITDGGQQPIAFTSTWLVTAGETITLPYAAAGTYSGTIDWGDSTTSVNSYANRMHTYATAGTKTISITGVTIGFGFNNTGSKLNIRTITNWGTLRLGNSGGYFYGCLNLTLTTVAGTLDLTGTTNFNIMFGDCLALTTVNGINSWNTAAVTSMGNVFFSCGQFNSDISSWNTSAVTSMAGMFFGCGTFNQNISSWNTGAVQGMSQMFFASAFNQNIGSWNVANVTNMSQMFQANSAFNQNIGSWNVANVANFTNFMGDKTPSTFSPSNLDAIYNGWVTVQSSRTISFGTAKYSAAGVAGRAYLTGTKLWTITDGGL